MSNALLPNILNPAGGEGGGINWMKEVIPHDVTSVNSIDVDDVSSETNTDWPEGVFPFTMTFTSEIID